MHTAQVDISNPLIFWKKLIFLKIVIENRPPKIMVRYFCTLKPFRCPSVSSSFFFTMEYVNQYEPIKSTKIGTLIGTYVGWKLHKWKFPINFFSRKT